jgi:hypothetical protein
MLIVCHRLIFEALLYLVLRILCSNKTFVAEIHYFLTVLIEKDIRGVAVYKSLFLHKFFQDVVPGDVSQLHGRHCLLTSHRRAFFSLIM